MLSVPNCQRVLMIRVTIPLWPSGYYFLFHVFGYASTFTILLQFHACSPSLSFSFIYDASFDVKMFFSRHQHFFLTQTSLHVLDLALICTWCLHSVSQYLNNHCGPRVGPLFGQYLGKCDRPARALRHISLVYGNTHSDISAKTRFSY